jgi:hypothetical protein
VGFDPQEALTKHDKTRNVKNRVGIQIVELNPVGKEKAAEKWMRGKRQTPQQKGDKNYPESEGWPGNDLWAGGERFRRRVLQKTHFLGLGQFLVPNLGLDPATDGGALGVGSLGLLGGSSGAGGCGAPLAHGQGAAKVAEMEMGR